MYDLYNNTVQFVATSVGIFFTMSPAQLVVVLWPFALVELPRFLLTELLVLFHAMRPEPREKAVWVRHLQQKLPLVSVVLPGYNERETLETTVLALREQSYPNKEIIVVSDGSTDGMDRVGQDLARRGWIRFFHHRMRGGKSSAANMAGQAARGEFVVICDADSTFDRDAIWHLLAEFYRPEVYAVAGNLRVRNYSTNLLTWLQGIQYVTAIGIGRRVSTMLGILFIVSGAFGAIRRSALQAAAGWDVSPGEDADLTVKARVAGGDIAFAPKAICMTDAPVTWWAFFRQQMRWNRSVVRVRIRKHGWLLNPFKRPFELRNLLGTIDILLYQLIFAFTFPIYMVWLYVNHGDIFWYLMTAVALLYMAVGYIQYLIVLALSERPHLDLKFFPYIPLYGLFMGLWLRTVRMLAYLDEFLFRSSYKDSFVPDHVQKQSRTNPW